jgi:hypothetical protein
MAGLFNVIHGNALKPIIISHRSYNQLKEIIIRTQEQLPFELCKEITFYPVFPIL